LLPILSEMESRLAVPPYESGCCSNLLTEGFDGPKLLV